MMKPGDNAGAKAAALPARAAPRNKGSLWEVMVLHRAWHFFTSMKLGLVLILAITAVALVGTLVDQAPPSVVANSGAYAEWLTRAETKYGSWTGVFDRLQLFNVFHSLYFRALMGLLTVNIVICTINRWPGIWKTIFHTRVRMGDAFFQHARFNATIGVPMPAGDAADRVKRALSHSHYRVKTEPDTNSVALFGDRNRLTRFGTFFTHLSLVLILAGTVVGGIWGFKDGEFVVSEGARRDLGLGTGISVQLDHFADEYYLDGPPKDYKSDIVLYDNGKVVKQGTIRVNSPMRYKGIAFHQAFYGQTAVMKVQDKSGKVLFEEGVPLAWTTREGNRPVGNFNLPQQNLAVYVVGPRTGETDPLIPAGEMRLEIYRQDDTRLAAPDNLSQGTPKDIAGLNFTFERESRFTGLKVVKDPGVNIIWIASGLMVLGMVMLFYLPRRRLWALCKSQPDGTTEVRLGMSAQRDLSLADEFQHLQDKVARALGTAQASAQSGQGGTDV